MAHRITITLCLAAAMVLVSGCIRRTIEIDSNPQGAIVYLNDEEVGRTPTQAPFLWYGKYDVRLDKTGYRTLNTVKDLKAPATELPGPDLVVEMLPWTTHYKFQWNFDLEPAGPVSEEGLIGRGKQMRELLDVPPDQLPAD